LQHNGVKVTMMLEALLAAGHAKTEYRRMAYQIMATGLAAASSCQSQPRNPGAG
jgi:hypothetical protein